MLNARVPKILYSKVTTGPAIEPIDIDDIAKLDLKVDDTVEDDLIEILIQAARESVENRTNRSLITQTREVRLDWFPSSDTIILPNGPVQSVTSIQYYDDNNDLTTLSNNDYWVDINSTIPRIVIKNYWPSSYSRPNAVIIIYVAGYGTAATTVPATLRKAMLLILGHLYENRQSVIVSGSPTGVVEMPMGAEYLMNQYIVEQSIVY
jgi:uncharacterized phiE125 gp8 family phage protein